MGLVRHAELQAMCRGWVPACVRQRVRMMGDGGQWTAGCSYIAPAGVSHPACDMSASRLYWLLPV